MNNTFDALINSFILNQVGIAEHFIPNNLAIALKRNLEMLYEGNEFKNAGTGSEGTVTYNKLMRSDVIYWLDRSHGNKDENAFLDLVDQFVLYLNQTCYTGITGYEFHYALYPPGSYYKKHLDQFSNSSRRKYSMIMYLNNNWREGDGGELCVYHTHLKQNITPLQGRSVFFQSDNLQHEVLVTAKPRMSITGWLTS